MLALPDARMHQKESTAVRRGVVASLRSDRARRLPRTGGMTDGARS